VSYGVSPPPETIDEELTMSNALEARLLALEASNRSLRRALCSVLVLLASLLGIAWVGQDPKPLRVTDLTVRSLTIVDGDGAVIATLGPTSRLNGRNEVRTAGALTLSDPNSPSKQPATAKLEASGAIFGGVEVLMTSVEANAKDTNPHAKPHVSISVEPEGSTLRLTGKSPSRKEGDYRGGSAVYLSSEKHPNMQFFDGEGNRRAVLGVATRLGRRSTRC
jgi:hypothetical protein